MKLVFLALFLCVLVAVLGWVREEGFLDADCRQYERCGQCTNQSACRWCETTQTCQAKEDDCEHPITDSPSCPVVHDAGLYEGRVEDAVRPPNVYQTTEVSYTPETIMAELQHLQQRQDWLEQRLPDIMAKGVVHTIGPMVRGVTCDPAPFR